MPFSTDELFGKEYSWQLPPRGANYLNVDLAQLGVAGDNSWGLIAHPEHRLGDKTYQYSYYIEAIQP
jgi:beta-galactosidase